jgi:hypothetical protein
LAAGCNAVYDAYGYQPDMDAYSDLGDTPPNIPPDAPAPGETSMLAGVLAAAAAPVEPGPVAGEQAAIAAFRAARRDRAVAPHGHRKRRWVRMGTARLAAAGLAAGAVLACGVAAAATGSLPGTARQVARDVLTHLGTVPGPAVPEGRPVMPSDASRRDGAPDGVAQPNDGAGDSTRDRSAGTGEEISETARTTNQFGVEKGAAISDKASNGGSHAGEQDSHYSGPRAKAPVAVPDRGPETDDAGHLPSGGASPDTADPQTRKSAAPFPRAGTGG